MFKEEMDHHTSPKKNSLCVLTKRAISSCHKLIKIHLEKDLEITYVQ